MEVIVNEAEKTAFLARPLTAIVSTIGRDGAPRGTPVWFLYEDGRVFIWTDAGRRWVRNILRTPRVAVTLAEHEPPFAALLLRGTATVHRDHPDAAGIIRRITAKYIPPAEIDAYIAQYAALTTIVEVAVTSSAGWGRGY
jgi:PPOX class probable F420-dependent enzyme